MVLLAVYLSVGGAFYRLAKKFRKGKILYALIGAAMCFLFSSLLFSVFAIIMKDNSMVHEVTGIFKLQFMSLAGGSFLCYVIYAGLKYLWKTERKKEPSNLLDEDVL